MRGGGKEYGVLTGQEYFADLAIKKYPVVDEQRPSVSITFKIIQKTHQLPS